MKKKKKTRKGALRRIWDAMGPEADRDPECTCWAEQDYFDPREMIVITGVYVVLFLLALVFLR